MNWNLETFFDAQFDGNEYEEFKSSKSGWNTEKYDARLERLADTIIKLDADIVIMEELEKAGQIHDIYNKLMRYYNRKKLYSYAAFSKEKDASIGCGVISRFPLTDISLHSLSINSEKTPQPPLRPILQFTLTCKEHKIIFFVNHWKSKSGGAEQSEVWRNWQEKQLARLMKNSAEKSAVIACGDFNRDISEFNIQEDLEAKVILRGDEDFEVYSPWLSDSRAANEIGSYFYKDNWEKIDHIFCAGEVEIKDFKAERAGDWADTEGKPFRYSVWSGKGYSDHLPLTCTVIF